MLEFIKHLTRRRSAGPADDVQRSEERIRIEYDDWGFAEFVHQSHLAAVEKEIGAISAISGNQDSLYGWTDIHLRDEISEPLLPAKIAVKALHDLFPRRTEYAGVGYWGGDEVAGKCFAFETRGGLVLYGDYYPGNGAEHLRSICFKPCNLPDKHVLSLELEALTQFAARQQFLLVCWNQEFCSKPDAGRYLQFFQSYR